MRFRLAVLCAGWALTACDSDDPGTGPDDVPPLSEATGWIYFGSAAPGTSPPLVTLRRIRPDGSDQTTLELGDGVTLLSYHLSPAAPSVAAAVRDWDAPGAPPRVVLLDGDGGSLRTVPVTAAGVAGYTDPRWSPDGGSLLVTVVGEGAGRRYLALVAESGELTPVTEALDGDSYSGRWSPAGSRVAFLWLPEGDSLPRSALVDPGGEVFGAAFVTALDPPVWKPDGTRVVYAAFDRDAPDRSQISLVTVGRDGNDVLPLLPPDPNRGNPIRPVFTPGGSRLAFSALNADGNEDVFVMDVDGTDLATLVGGAGDQREVAFSPDGRFVAYRSAGELWIRAVEGGPRARLSPSVWEGVVWVR